MSNVRPPQFFKIFFPEIHTKRLIIPLGFVKHMKGQTSGMASLVGPSGNTWLVNLIWKKDRLLFTEGWPAFVKDHSSEHGDFLVFKYNGNFNFVVTVYDKSGCEKESAFHAKCSQCKREAAGSSYETSEGAPGESLNTLARDVHDKKVQGKTDERRAYEFLATDHPYFVCCMKQFNIHGPFFLYVPASFVQKYCASSQKKQMFVLSNSKGNQWSVTLIRQRNGGCLSAGWCYFVRDNHIKKGDKCAFELIGKFEFLVHVYRGDEELK